jgi:CheY-like chemotaxis protein
VNAADSIGRSGTISVSLRPDEARNRLVLAVSDTGAGIPQEDVPRLFDPFFTTKRMVGPAGEQPSHLGLGLPESLKIVREYGGDIRVESEPNRGATFTITLPVRSAPTDKLVQPPGTEMLPGAGTRMLVVDDDELMRFWLTKHLGGRGYDVVAVDNGLDAVRACEERAFPFVFLDLLMPGELDGAATLARLKELRPAANIVLITAFARSSIPAECLDAAHAVLNKPFGAEDLERALAGMNGAD